MVSPELIRRYPIFAGLSLEQITTLAQVAEEMAVKAEYYFFREGEELDHFYIVLEGRVGILVDLPVQSVRQPVSRQITGSLETREVVVSTIEPGEMFAWSTLIPPYTATSSAKALTSSRVVSFDCRELRKIFEEDCRFAYLMVQKTAQLIRRRLRDMRIESLSLRELPIP
jgi:CRP/FNR family cyclic AMP-dependent transcriptional regulator